MAPYFQSKGYTPTLADMVEILRPTAIGRLEELGVNQDSSLSLGECGEQPLNKMLFLVTFVLV